MAALRPMNSIPSHPLMFMLLDGSIHGAIQIYYQLIEMEIKDG